MRALVCEGTGQRPIVRHVPRPRPRPGEVVVAVSAASINSPDNLMIAGGYQIRPACPFVVGCEFAGHVAEVGQQVDRWSSGDPVMGTCFTGAFAEQVCVPAARLLPVPAEVAIDIAAALPVAGRTAVQALVFEGETSPGDRVVVLGAAGGVGHFCVQVARRLGGHVVAVASGAERRAFCVTVGASTTLDARQPDLKEQLRLATDGGADVVVDLVGGHLSEVALRASRWGARFVTAGFASGSIPAIPLNLVLLKGVQIRGVETRALTEHHPERIREGDELLAELLRQGLRPRITARYPLDRAADGLSALSRRQSVGKLLVDIATSSQPKDTHP